MKLIEIYDGTYAECVIIKTILEDSEIDPFLKDEIIGLRKSPWSQIIEVRLIVSDPNYDKAKLMVSE